MKQKDLGEKQPPKPKTLSQPKRSLVDRVKQSPLGVKIGSVAGLGALVLFGVPALIPVAIGGAGLGGFYFYKKRKYSQAMTPERIKVYEQALSSLKDAAKLRVLADEFEKAGCVKEATHLRKRASLRDRPPAEKKADQDRYKRAMADTSSERVMKEATYFEGVGADGAAKNLRTKADALKTVGK